MAKPSVSSEALEELERTDSEYFGLESELKRATIYTLVALGIWLAIICGAAALMF